MKELNLIWQFLELNLKSNPNIGIVVNGKKMTVSDFLRAIEIGIGVLEGVYTAFDEEGGQL